MAELRTESRTEWISAPKETGGRDACCGHDSFQVTGDGHGYQPFRGQPFSLQPAEAWCQLLMAERPTPELPPPVPVTRHLALYLSLYSILDTPASHFCTFARGSAAFAPLHGIFVSLANVSTCQLVNSRKRLSPCHRAHVSPRGIATCPHVTVPACPLAHTRAPLAVIVAASCERRCRATPPSRPRRHRSPMCWPRPRSSGARNQRRSAISPR